MSEPEVPVRLAQLWLCDLCLDGAGGECHTPGCALWINRAPDLPLRDSPFVAIMDNPAAELNAAVRHFAETWRDTLPELPDAYTCTYTCAEANAAADLYRALGDPATADAIIANHAHYDEDGDEHYGQESAGRQP